MSRDSRTLTEDKELGNYKTYIPGVGTSFPEIGEAGESDLGGAFALGCEERLLYGLLVVINALHRRVFNDEDFFDDDEVKALCRNHNRASSDDRSALARLGEHCGLLRPDLFGSGGRKEILERQAGRVALKIAKARPLVLGSCYLDVFGFSRGAAQARVFCNWLSELLLDGKLAGIPIRLRFLGLMDTVASAGFVSSVSAGLTNRTGGHSGWASTNPFESYA
jgi:hypothetical protein